MERKLRLEVEMGHTRLIQRLQAPEITKIGGKEIDNPFMFGGGLVNGGLSKDAMGILRHIFSFDYMGAAEFEWGAVPNALTFLAEQSAAGNLVTGSLVFKGKSVFYICPKLYEDGVKERITKLYDKDKDIDLKAHCGLQEALTSEKDYARRNKGWLELNNGFAFFVDKEMFGKFCMLMGVKEGV